MFKKQAQLMHTRSDQSLLLWRLFLGFYTVLTGVVLAFLLVAPRLWPYLRLDRPPYLLLCAFLLCGVGFLIFHRENCRRKENNKGVS